MSNTVWNRLVAAADIELGIELDFEHQHTFQSNSQLRELVEAGEYTRAVHKWNYLYQ